MELIDRDELIEIINYTFSKPPFSRKTIKRMIDMARTVDAVPVKHGKWIHEVRYTIDSLHSYQQYRCSKCGMTYITNTNYCPECGARMDEHD